MSHVSLQEFLKTEPDGTLEVVAEQYNTTLLEVVKNLPSSTIVSGDKFDTVWDTVCEWGNVTTLVHTADVILEFSGELPSVSPPRLFQPTRKARHVRAYQSRKLHTYCLDRT